MMDGFFINGPLLHYCYEILEKYMPAEESMFAAVSQVCVVCSCGGSKKLLLSPINILPKLLSVNHPVFVVVPGSR